MEPDAIIKSVFQFIAALGWSINFIASLIEKDVHERNNRLLTAINMLLLCFYFATS